MNTSKTLQVSLIAALVAVAVGCNRHNNEGTRTTTTDLGSTTTYPVITTTTVGALPTTTLSTTGSSMNGAPGTGTSGSGAAGSGTGTGMGTSGTGTSGTGTSGTGTSGTSRGGSGATDSSNVMGSGSASASGKAHSAKQDKKSGGELSSEDRKFINKAASGGMFEVEMGRVAAERATDPAVKSYASMLVDDHSKANDELKELASNRNLTLPTKLPADKQASIDRLTKLSADRFDHQYVQTVGLKDHQHDIQDFEKASKKTKDADLKAWIDKTLPTLRKHLSEAEKLASGSGGGKTGSRSSSSSRAPSTPAASGSGAPGAAGVGSAGSASGAGGASGTGASGSGAGGTGAGAAGSGGASAGGTGGAGGR